MAGLGGIARQVDPLAHGGQGNVWVVLLGVGGVLFPPELMPAAARPIVELLPSAGLADGLRGALGTGSFDAGAALVLLIWGLLATAAALRTFRWSD